MRESGCPASQITANGRDTGHFGTNAVAPHFFVRREVAGIAMVLEVRGPFLSRTRTYAGFPTSIRLSTH